MKLKSILAVLFLVATPFASHASSTDSLSIGDAGNGEKLHARFCTGCHTTTVYTRPGRVVKSYGGLVGRVGGCSSQLKLDFSRDQINDIVAYLNGHYYKYDPEK